VAGIADEELSTMTPVARLFFPNRTWGSDGEINKGTLT
jgi:hypothetical protein